MVNRLARNRRSAAIGWCLGVVLLALASPLSAEIVADIVARCPTSPRSLSEVMAALDRLQTTGRCTLTLLGNTPQKRPLVLAEVTDPQSPYRKATLFIIARQHGNEPAGTEAALALLEHFATAPTTLEKEILKFLRLVAVPVANPDGTAVGRRANANGVDLNRDWAALSQPETRMIDAAVRRVQPDAILDLHELPANSAKDSYGENFLETVGSSAALPALLSQRTKQITKALTAWLRTFGYNHNVYYDYPGDNLMLCHRYFGLYQQYPTFLCEAKTGPGRPLRTRVGFHVVSALVVANYLMHEGAVSGLAASQPTAAAPKVAAASPDAAPQPPTPAPEPAQVQVTLDPAEGGRKQEARLRVQVRGGEGFSYVELSVGGKTRALSNLRDNLWPLNLGSLPPGTYQVRVTAYAEGETEMARGEITVKVTEQSVLAAF